MNIITFRVSRDKGIKGMLVAIIAVLGVHVFCYLPLLLGLLGLGNAGLASRIMGFQMVFYVISIVAMLFANWFTFRQPNGWRRKVSMIFMDMVLVYLLVSNYLKHSYM